MSLFGYNGKLLGIDLTNRTAQWEERDDIFWRHYVGGGLLATRHRRLFETGDGRNRRP